MIPTFLPGIPIHIEVIASFEESLRDGISIDIEITEHVIDGETFYGAKVEEAADVTRRLARSRHRALAFALEDLAAALK